MIKNGVDKDGNLYLTYAVSVSCKDGTILSLGTGMDSVIKFYNIAEAGIPGALKTEFLFSCNVLVTLRGDSMLSMLNEHYPDIVSEAREVIDPEKEYVVDCYDMS